MDEVDGVEAASFGGWGWEVPDVGSGILGD